MLEKLDACVSAASLVNEIGMAGLKVRQISDLSEARRLLDVMGALNSDNKSNGPYVTKFLDPHKNILTRDQSFWLFLFDENDVPVGKMATRIDRLREESLHNFMVRAVHALHPDCADPPSPDRIPSFANEISGSVAYCGDLYMSDAARLRGQVPAFIRLNYLLMLMEWGVPDWTLCFVWEKKGQSWKWLDDNWIITKNTCSYSFPLSAENRDVWMGAMNKANFTKIVSQTLHSTAV